MSIFNHPCLAKRATCHPRQPRYPRQARSPKGQIQTSSECSRTRGDVGETGSTKPEQSPKMENDRKRQELVEETSQGQASSHLRSAAGELDIYNTENIRRKLSAVMVCVRFHCHFLRVNLLIIVIVINIQPGLLSGVSTSRQPGRAAEFETTGSGAGGRQRRPQTKRPPPECGAESVSGRLQASVPARGLSKALHIQISPALDTISPLPLKDGWKDFSWI